MSLETYNRSDFYHWKKSARALAIIYPVSQLAVFVLYFLTVSVVVGIGLEPSLWGLELKLLEFSYHFTRTFGLLLALSIQTYFSIKRAVYYAPGDKYISSLYISGIALIPLFLHLLFLGQFNPDGIIWSKWYFLFATAGSMLGMGLVILTTKKNVTLGEWVKRKFRRKPNLYKR